MKTVGLSPKVINSFLTGLAVFLFTKLGLQWDPIVEQAINVASMLLVAYLSKPGDVVRDVDPDAGDVRPPATA